MMTEVHRETPEFKTYITRRLALSVQSGVLLWGIRVIIPQYLRGRILEHLPEGYPGVVKMKELACSYFWWPGLDAQIKEKWGNVSPMQN